MRRKDNHKKNDKKTKLSKLVNLFKRSKHGKAVTIQPTPPKSIEDLPNPLIEKIISTSTDQSQSNLAQVSKRFNALTSKTNNCFMLFRKTNADDPIQFINNDNNELLHGEIFKTEYEAKDSLEEQGMSAPVIIQLNLSTTNMNFFIKNSDTKSIVAKITSINSIPVEYQGDQLKVK